MARKKQGYNARLDESLGERNRGKKRKVLNLVEMKVKARKRLWENGPILPFPQWTREAEKRKLHLKEQ